VSFRETFKRRAGGGVWAGAWMWPLIWSAASIAQGKVHYPVFAIVGLAVFVVLYLFVVTAGFDDAQPRTEPVHVVALFLVAAVGIALLWTYGTDNGWENVILYVAVSGVTLLGTRKAITWVVASSLVFVAYVTVGPGHVLAFSDWGSLLFSAMMASALVFTIKQMIGYIALLRSTRQKLAHTAVSEERLRFSRDLHDLLGHTLSLIVVKAEVVRRLVEQDPAAAAREAADIESIGRQALTEVREAVSGYREPEFATELDGARTALQDAGITVRIVQDATPLPSVPSKLFGWAIREASTNVIRHSGARSVTIVVHSSGEVATMEVSDDGVGRRTKVDAGTGLLGLTERFGQAGGTVTTTSSPSGGFRLVASVPMPVTATCEVAA